MPKPRRYRLSRRDVTEAGWHQLLVGFDHTGQKFNRNNIRCRRRDGATDPVESDLTVVRAAYLACREELLSLVDDPEQCWAFRRFEGEQDA